jgi:hypothetical protein
MIWGAVHQEQISSALLMPQMYSCLQPRLVPGYFSFEIGVQRNHMQRQSHRQQLHQTRLTKAIPE